LLNQTNIESYIPAKLNRDSPERRLTVKIKDYLLFISFATILFVLVGTRSAQSRPVWAIPRQSHGAYTALLHEDETEPGEKKLRSEKISLTQINLNSTHVNPGEGTVMRAFVETGTNNPNCLTTLAESNNASTGITMFCAPRAPSGRKGVLVSVFFPAVPSADVVLSLTLFQEEARRYGPPVLCTGIDGC
jgi:hypothetical protein